MFHMRKFKLEFLLYFILTWIFIWNRTRESDFLALSQTIYNIVNWFPFYYFEFFPIDYSNMIILKYPGSSMLIFVTIKVFIYHINIGDNVHNLCHIMSVNSAFKELVCWKIWSHWKEVLIKVERFSRQRGIKFSNISLGASALPAGKKN